jgi:GMP synthase PP-ATPase subunit
MREITYQVKIADATGHTVAQMTKPEIVAKATASQGTWVFVNDRLVSASELNSMTFEAADEFKLMPGLVGGKEPTFFVEIADASGHSVVEMTQGELVEKATGSNTAWVFVDNTMVAAKDIEAMDLSVAQKIRMVPPLVGGTAQ